MKYLESYEDKYLHLNQKVGQDIKDKLLYKEGDVVFIKYDDGNPHGFYEGPAEILFVRKFMKNNTGYGVVGLGGNPDYYFEVDDSDIERKLDPHEVSAIKYNI